MTKRSLKRTSRNASDRLVEITPNTPDVDLAALSTSRRASEARRDTLERLASLCTPRDVSVSVTFSEDGATCSPDEDRPGEAYIVQIPTKAYDQPGTDLPEIVWNKRVQVGLLFHELGHVLYSDFERFQERLKAIRPEWRGAFKTVYNAAEDGVVETQIANEFRVTEDLTLLNEAFTQLADDRHHRYTELFGLGPDASEGGDSLWEYRERHDERERSLRAKYSILDGVRVGLIDNGFTKHDRFATLLDETDETRTIRDGRGDILRDLAPTLERYMADMISEPDPTARVELARQFFEHVRDHLAPLPVLQARATDVFVVRPKEVEEGSLGGGKRADQLPNPEAADAYVKTDVGASNGNNPSDDDCDETATDPNAVGGASSGEDRSHLPPGRVAQRELQRYAQRAGQGRTVRGTPSESPLEANANDLRELTRTTSGIERIGIAEATGDDSSRHIWDTAVRQARQLKADLATQLHRRRRTSYDGGHRSGRLDGSRIAQAVQGDQRVFQRRTSGTDRDYSCVLVLDRSGSMQGDQITAAERAVGQLLAAFDAVDVDVGLLSLFRSVPYLEVPMGGAPTNHLDRFLRADAQGGTPLAETLSAARSLLAEGKGVVPLVFVITDGKPDRPEAYRRELTACSFPVFGVYVSPDRESTEEYPARDQEADAEYFDRLVRTDQESLDTRLRELVRSLFRKNSRS